MYQTYQPQYNRIQVQTGLKGRPVTSLEEAKASPIDFDGSIAYFPDVANQKIYTKQINMDGTSTLLMYQLTELPIEKPQAYITREEFETTIEQLRALLAPPQPPSQPVADSKPEFNF